MSISGDWNIGFEDSLPLVGGGGKRGDRVQYSSKISLLFTGGTDYLLDLCLLMDERGLGHQQGGYHLSDSQLRRIIRSVVPGLW
jgi:hypothetical protein